jgi:hypothetical protein
VDVSHYDYDRHGGNLDWPSIRAAGIGAVCVRASYGDPEGYHPETRHFRELAGGARAAGFALTGGYHNLIRGDVACHARQAAWFHSEIAAAGCTWAMLDVEPYDALKINGLWPRWSDVLAFGAAWRAVAGPMPLTVYLAYWVWADWLGRPDMSAIPGPLVSARYVVNVPNPHVQLYTAAGGDTSEAWEPYGGVTPSLWQFTSKAVVPGASTTTDVNAFRGTVAELAALLTGGATVASQGFRDWTNAGRPITGTSRPIARIGARLAARGYTVYYVGNDSHMQASTPEDHTPFSATGWPVAHPRWWINATDLMPPPAGKNLPSLQRIGAQMLADAKAGHPGMKWLKYMNWEPERDNGGACYQERFMPSYERRSSGDRGHIHLSGRSDMIAYTGGDDYDPVARILGGGNVTTGDDDMAVTIIYDGKGYSRGDGVTRAAILDWPEMIDIQALIASGMIKGGAAGARIVTVERPRPYGVLVDESAKPSEVSQQTLAAAITELTNRLAGGENGLPTDPAVIAAAVEAALADDVEALSADLNVLSEKLAADDNGLPADATAIKEAVKAALREGSA